MKGLLLKDLYLTAKYCRTFLLVSAIFILISPLSNGNMFMLYYPCMLAAITPSSLLSLDERSGWELYAQTMPYTKAQLVSSKYLLGLAFQLVIVFSSAVLHALTWRGTAANYLAAMLSLLIVALLSSALPLPFQFKFGVERGRLAQYLLIVLICAGSSAFTALRLQEDAPTLHIPPAVWPVALLIAIALYALSWWLSIHFYTQRELGK